MKKIIAIILALVMCMSLFVGFTTVNPKDLSVVNYDVATGEITRTGEEPQSLTGAVRFPDGAKSYSASVSADVTRVNIGYKYSGNINELRVDNIIYHNYDFSSGYGYSALNIMGLTPGNHVITWSTRYGNDSYHQYTLNLKVGTVSEPVTTAIVQFLSRQQEPNKIIYSSVVNLNSALVMLGDNFDLGLAEDESVLGWSYFDVIKKMWVKMDLLNLPKVTVDKIENGVFRVAPIVDKKQSFVVTYYTLKSGFLNIKSWQKFDSIVVEQGKPVPDRSDVFVDNFISMTTDKAGKNVISSSMFVKEDIGVYIQLKELPDKIKVQYAGYFRGEPNRILYERYFAPGSDIDLTLAVSSITNDTGKVCDFTYWSTDRAGKNKVNAIKAEYDNIVLYAQYDGLDQKNYGIADFFKDLDNNVLKPMNSWWGIDSVVTSYIITVLVLALGLAFLIRFLITLFRSISFGR